MTSFDRFEQDLPEHLAELAAARIPDYFDDLLQQAARTRQRPAWSSFERWLPMGVTALSPVSNRARAMAGFVLLILLGLLVAATLSAYVGSHPQRIPAPFGPAGNGSWYYSAANGDVYTADPATGASRLILAGAHAEPQAAPSHDGSLIEFARRVTGGEQVVVAAADGSNARALPGTWAGYSEVDWSPDSTKLAIVSTVDGVSSLSILPVDGSSATTLPLGLDVHNICFLADGKLAFLGTTTTGTGATLHGIYVANADGTGLRAVEPPTPDENDWIGISASPDGRSLVYHRWRDPGETGRLHIVDIETGKDTPVQVDGTVDDEHHEGAQFSPDGSHLLFTRYAAGSGDARLTVVPVGGGAAISMGPAVPFAVSPEAFYSPDGRSVIAYYPGSTETWLLDPTGGQAGGDRKLALPVSAAPTWQRVAP